MRSRHWKWIGLGALAAIAVGGAVAVGRRRRHWHELDTAEVRTRLHDRFAALEPSADRPSA